MGTDKNFLHSYITEIYEPIFSILSSPESILEIGIQHKASLALWKMTFNDAIVMGWDIDVFQPTHPIAQELVESGKIQLIQRDAYRFINDVPKDLSVIIDDGPHTLPSQIKALDLRNKLSENGILIIEDIGEIGGPRYCFFKLLRALPFKERKYSLNINLSEKKGRWDDAVFVYSRNEEILEILSSRHKKLISSYWQLLAYSFVWRSKLILKSLTLHIS